MKLTVNISFNIETSEGFVIHPKIIDLMREIELSGSLNAAVNEIGMSYSYAWNMLNKANCKLGTPIVVTKRGGNGGGIAYLTEAGQKLLSICNKLEKDFEAIHDNQELHIED